ncbi:TolC family protein [Bacteroidales bacterium OttesenSCG-928-B11]|nr:TolC family protein [Bacteroidales bacterium OttesenSCG-928-C03]MDL2311442.1 TolC family protein [Bacteroidales bacterium OttesenSCG-928-B11]
MKKLVFLTIILLSLFRLQAQVTLDDCQRKARANYPLIKQYELINAVKKYNIAQIHKAYLPQFSLGGRVTWQSDVTEFPEAFTGLLDLLDASITFPGQDQYLFSAELSQTVWDGGITTMQKKMVAAQHEVEQQNLEVTFYTLNEQINQLFFSILLLKEQLIQNVLLQEELERNQILVASYMENGIAQQSDLDEIKVEILSVQQRNIEITTTKKSLLKVLGAFIGEKIPEEATFVKPPAALDTEKEINRPELKLFDSQVSLFRIQGEQLWSKGMPRVALFAKGAYGNPGLNMFESGFTPYFIGGVQLAWNFGGFYTNRDEKRLLENQKSQVEVQREVFLFNLNQEISQKDDEIEKLRDLLQNDDEIIRLRESVQRSSEVKVESGTMSVSDLMRDIHATAMARQTKAWHEIQLLNAVWQRKLMTNDQ